MKAITTEQMLAELAITFPTLWTKPLREFGGSYANAEGVWTGEDSPHVMPDGDPIFHNLAEGEPYDNDVHTGFTEWLRLRGWHYERYDGGTYFLVPCTDEELAYMSGGLA